MVYTPNFKSVGLLAIVFLDRVHALPGYNCLPGFTNCRLVHSENRSSTVKRSTSAQLVRRNEPVPSQYPLGTPWTNEWQYVNFDPVSDKANLEQIHNAFPQIMTLASVAIASAKDPGIPYNRFLDGDDKNEIDTDILPPLLKIVPGANEDAGPAVSNVVIDAEDFGAGIVANGVDLMGCDDDTFAYTNARLNKIHFCPLGYKLPDMSQMTCASLSPYSYPSDKIDGFARLGFHELLHPDVVSKDTTGVSIVDQNNDDGEKAYGPLRAHALLEEDDGKCSTNADNFSWMAVNSYFTYRLGCGVLDDPPHY